MIIPQVNIGCNRVRDDSDDEKFLIIHVSDAYTLKPGLWLVLCQTITGANDDSMPMKKLAALC